MEPGVPFALLGTVVLLAVAAWLALGALALATSAGRRLPAVLLAVGAVVLATVEVVTATGLGRATSDQLPVVRAAGLLLLVGGLYAGTVARAAVAGPAGAVVVPLGSGAPPAVLAAAAAVAGALASLRARRDAAGLLLAGGLLLSGASAGLGPLADDRTGALTVLGLRGASALLLLAGLLALARSSLLGKVVAAVLAGVLVTALAAVGVVGTVVADAAVAEQDALVQDASLGRQERVLQLVAATVNDASFSEQACRERPAACADVVDQLAGAGAPTFAVRVPAVGAPVSVGGRRPLGPAELLALAGDPLVALAGAGGPEAVQRGAGGVVRLVGQAPGLAAIAVVSGPRPSPQATAPSVFVVGVRLDDAFAGSDTGIGGFGLSLLVGDRVVASNLTGAERARLQQIAVDAGVARGTGQGRTVSADGERPSVSFRPLPAVLGDPAGTLAVSRSADRSLAAQERALQSLLLAAVLATVVVGGLALVLGRRTVEPVRRLTAAAQRVAAGELSVTTGLTGRDEVGTLSRSFDAMTGSVSRLTGDLQASAARLATVLSSMSDGLVAVDGAGTVTSCNRAGLVMAALDEPAAVGRPLREVLDLQVSGEPLDLQAATGVDVAAEVHRGDGTRVPVQVAVADLPDGQGRVLVLRDTTREREVERMKTDFLSNVSHELRTPLTPIRGYAEILVGKPGLPSEKVTAFATTIRDESLKMNRVVDLLVDVAAIEAGRVTTTPLPVPPASLVDDRLSAWRARAPDRARDLRRRVAAGLPPVEVDPSWVGKALDELIDNAVKHTPPGTAITLTASLSPAGDRVRVGVRDNGPGIAEADRAGLLRSFEQVDGSATRRVGGLGLGLSFVRRLAADSGLPLTVSSTVGRGSEFSLDLPLAAPVRGRRRRPLR